MSRKTLAMTGATGFVGATVLEAALAAGHQVRALTRRPQAPRTGVTWVAGALDAPETLIVQSTAELIPLPESSALADALSRAGVPNQVRIGEGSRHAEFIVREDPEAMAELLSFLDQTLRS